ncbi:MAG TPA: RDD family protein [Baekduia sp.]
MTAVAADRFAPPAPPRPVPYVGLVTRGIAFALDAAIINAVAITVSALMALILSMFSDPGWLKTFVVAAGAVAYVLWLVGYFVFFWTTTGQTPGDRMMRFRVRSNSGGRLKPRRALLRFVALVLAALPLFAGFLMILFDRRRRGLHDWIARTVVVDEQRPARRR